MFEFDIAGHADMLSDPVRVGAYARALRESVRPDDVVLDAGCGIGVFAVLAARAGARRVYAVDTGDSAHWARRVAVENGVGDRVVVLRGRLEDLRLPEAPTLVVADVRGGMPLAGGAPLLWNAVVGALAPGGRCIPRRDVVFAQPIASEALHERTHGFGPIEGVGVGPLRSVLTESTPEVADDAAPRSDAQPLFEIRYGARLAARYAGQAEFVADVPWTVDGFRLGFEADLAPGISYRTFGPARVLAYGLPVAPTPGRLVVPAGAALRLRLRCDVDGAHAPISWAVDLGDREGAWQGPLAQVGESLDVLGAGLPDFVPAPDASDDLDGFILGEFGRGRSVGATTASARTAFGGTTSEANVERRVVDLARRRQARVVRRLGPA